MVMENHLLSKGLKIVGRFNCFGQFLAINRGRPDTKDLEKAREFARSMVLQEYPQMGEIQPFTATAGAAIQG